MNSRQPSSRSRKSGIRLAPSTVSGTGKPTASSRVGMISINSTGRSITPSCRTSISSRHFNGSYGVRLRSHWWSPNISPWSDLMIDMPCSRPASLMFGGPYLDILFVPSIRDSGNVRGDRPIDDALFAVHGLGVTGLPEPRFAG